MEVLKRARNTSYRVALPTWMKIHPVIRVSNLKPFHQDPKDMQHNVIVRPTIDLSHKEDKDVEEILVDGVKMAKDPQEGAISTC